MLALSSSNQFAVKQNDHTKVSNKNRSPKSVVIENIAKKALKEFAVMFLISAVTLYLTAAPIGVLVLLADIVTVVAINALIRYVLEKYKNHEIIKRNPVVKYLAPAVYCMFDMKTRDVVVHESGHALSARWLYQLKSPPNIEVFPSDPVIKMPFKRQVGGGVTRVVIKGYTIAGKFFGPVKSQIIFAAAGAASSIFCAVFHIILAHRVRKTNPELSRYLNMTAITSIANHTLYALSAIGNTTKNYGHDFIRLAMLGVNPLICAIVIVAIPVIVKLGLYYCSSIAPKMN